MGLGLGLALLLILRRERESALGCAAAMRQPRPKAWPTCRLRLATMGFVVLAMLLALVQEFGVAQKIVTARASGGNLRLWHSVGSCWCWVSGCAPAACCGACQKIIWLDRQYRLGEGIQ